jgi:exonuclease III
MRLLAWNVRTGNAPGLFDAIVAMDPDLAILGDCRQAQRLRLISEGSERGYPYAVQTTDQATAGILAISRHPIIRGEVHAAPLPGRWLHVLTHDGFSVGAVYGPLPGIDGSTATENYWAWLTTIAIAWANRPALFCGDFNSGNPASDSQNSYPFPGASHFIGLGDIGWRDAFRDRHAEAWEYSWRSPQNGFRIDHCLLSPAAPPPKSVAYVREVGALTLGGLEPGVQAAAHSLSDHAALMVEI